MRIPEVVVFDLGKVLVDFDYSIAVQRIAARCKGNNCDLLKLVTPEAQLLFDYECGLMSTEAFFAEVCKVSGFEGELAEFSAMFADIFSEIEPMIAFNESLRARGIPTYIFSNTNPLAIEHIRRQFPFFSNFTDYVLSYEHGAMKPQEKIYTVVERMTGQSGDAILYIDDRPENIDGGIQRGWQTILQEHPDKTLRKVRDLGL